MFEKSVSSLPLWQFEILSDFNSINHFVSSRRGGVSSGEKSSLNLSFKVGDNPESVKTNRGLISTAMKLAPSDLVFPVQTHSINIEVLNSSDDLLENTDAIITHLPGICLSVMSADCVSVLLFDPVKKVIGAAHAGWKGTVGKIAAKTVTKMQFVYGSDPSDIIACLGPSISKEVYEVGSEVIQEVRNAFSNIQRIIYPVQLEGKAFLDLWEANKIQLLEAGLKAEHIEISGICTFKNSEEFFSARKSKNEAGRFAAGIMLN